MSKDLIVYYSKNGTTAETVERIKKEAKNEIEIFNLDEKPVIDISKYDRVFIGCGISASHLPMKVVKFIKSNSQQLKLKNISFFIHGIISEAIYNEIVSNTVDNILSSKDYKVFYLGGKLDINKQNFIVKQLLLSIAKQNNIDPYNANTLSEQRISELLKCFH